MDISNSLQVKRKWGGKKNRRDGLSELPYNLSAMIHVAMIGIKMLATPNCRKKKIHVSLADSFCEV